MPGAVIYVKLLNEGVDVWRPVDGLWQQGDVYRILSENEQPEDEEWEFLSGELVRCRETLLSGDFGRQVMVLVAFERVPAA
jgi:hypothetical protein